MALTANYFPLSSSSGIKSSIQPINVLILLVSSLPIKQLITTSDCSIKIIFYSIPSKAFPRTFSLYLHLFSTAYLNLRYLPFFLSIWLTPIASILPPMRATSAVFGSNGIKTQWIDYLQTQASIKWMKLYSKGWPST